MEEKGGIRENRKLALGTAWHSLVPRTAVSMGVWQGQQLHVFKELSSLNGWVDISKMGGRGRAGCCH